MDSNKISGEEVIEELCQGLGLNEKQLSRAFGITAAQLKVLKRADNISYTTQAGRRLKSAHNILQLYKSKGTVLIDKLKQDIENSLNKHVVLEDEKVVF